MDILLTFMKNDNIINIVKNINQDNMIKYKKMEEENDGETNTERKNKNNSKRENEILLYRCSEKNS